MNDVSQIMIGDKEVGGESNALIVAEIGPNHNGSKEEARKLIDAAKNSGCDGVKFQYHIADAEIFDRTSRSYYYEESRYEFIKRVQEFPHDVHRSIREYADSLGLLYICSVFSEETVDFVLDLEPDAVKVPSGEVGNPWLLEKLFESNSPIVVSSGMSPITEVDSMMTKILANTDRVILLHCVSEYPTLIDSMNLRMITELRKRYGCPVGLSDHSRCFPEIATAVALGACMIEVHFTFDRLAPGPDHSISLTPKEMKGLVTRIRKIECALGKSYKILGPHADDMRKGFTNSIVARRSIVKGETITRECLALKKPGTGLSPDYLPKVLGRKTRFAIKSNSLIKIEDLV